MGPKHTTIRFAHTPLRHSSPCSCPPRYSIPLVLLHCPIPISSLMALVDDDTFIRLDILLPELHRPIYDQDGSHQDQQGQQGQQGHRGQQQWGGAPSRRLYHGQIWTGRPIRDRRHKNWVSHDRYPLERFPPYASGAHYVLSADVLHYVVGNEGLLAGSLVAGSGGNLEDFQLGLWMFGVGVKPTHDTRFVEAVNCHRGAISLSNVPDGRDEEGDGGEEEAVGGAEGTEKPGGGAERRGAAGAQKAGGAADLTHTYMMEHIWSTLQRTGSLCDAALRAHGAAFYAARIRLNPRLPEALNNMGMLLFLAGEPEQALVAFGDALRLHPAGPARGHYREVRRYVGRGAGEETEGVVAAAVSVNGVQMRADPAGVVVGGKEAAGGEDGEGVAGEICGKECRGGIVEAFEVGMEAFARTISVTFWTNPETGEG